MRLGVISTPGVAYLTREMGAIRSNDFTSHNPVVIMELSSSVQMVLNYLMLKRRKLKHY